MSPQSCIRNRYCRPQKGVRKPLRVGVSVGWAAVLLVRALLDGGDQAVVGVIAERLALWFALDGGGSTMTAKSAGSMRQCCSAGWQWGHGQNGGGRKCVVAWSVDVGCRMVGGRGARRRGPARNVRWRGASRLGVSGGIHGSRRSIPQAVENVVCNRGWRQGYLAWASGCFT